MRWYGKLLGFVAGYLLMRHPAGVQPVLGTSRSDRLRACAQSSSVSLSREEWYRLFETARGQPMP